LEDRSHCPIDVVEVLLERPRSNAPGLDDHAQGASRSPSIVGQKREPPIPRIVAVPKKVYLASFAAAMRGRISQRLNS
jgi:hypothetical protein